MGGDAGGDGGGGHDDGSVLSVGVRKYNDVKTESGSYRHSDTDTQTLLRHTYTLAHIYRATHTW